MATLTVMKFETATGAEEALNVVKSLQAQHLIELHDAALVTWPTGKKKPKTEQLRDLRTTGALTGAFWGLLFGLIFLMPFVGLVFGAALGAITNSFVDFGIDDKFIKSVRSSVTEGTSALFLMTSKAVEDRVVEAFKELKFELLSTNLPKEKEDKLREAFAQE